MGSNVRDGTRLKTVLTQIGPVRIEVPRDRDSSLDPVVVPKRARRLEGVDEIVLSLSLSARGLTTGEIAAHFDEVYGATVSKDTVGRITEKVAGEMAEWSSRPLDPVYPVLFVDAIHAKVRDGQVRNKGLPEAITTTWDRTVVQQCIVHLIRNSFRYAGRQHRDVIVKALKSVCTAPSEAAVRDRFAEFAKEWGARYPAIVRLWESSWAEFVPFLEYDIEIRKVICTTNSIESINAWYRRAVRARGHFPTEAAALKCLYLVTRSLDPTGGGRARWVARWKAPLNAFAITFDGRLEQPVN